ncbi:MAG: Ankyrin [candidate division TM6 bacterium GW2011_GWE2_42_60]|nr:MAG: Ankyrin [candidate division TM6 bacterium GW2011_GWE2_42_60]
MASSLKKIFSLAALFVSQLLNASNSIELFYGALKANDTAQVKQCLKNNPLLANTPHKGYISPLFAAKNAGTVKLLLEHKSNPNILEPKFKVSPFFCFLSKASATQDFTIPQIFLDYVDITVPHNAIDKGAPLLATIWYASNNNWDSVTQWFAQQCKNPNAQDNQKRSLLHWAAHYRCLEAVRILLKRNADPNAKNIFDESPFSIALKNCVLKTGTTRIPLIFLAYGADPKFRYNNENLIHFFLTYCKDKKDLTQAIEYLIESGVNPLEPDSDGILPYEKAEKIGFDDVKKLLPSPTKLS